MMTVRPFVTASSGTNIDGAPHPTLASAAMRTLERDIECASQFDVNVMVSGESGVGKKSVAFGVHRRSARGDAPFVVASCQDAMASVLHDRTGSSSSDQFTCNLLNAAGNGTLLIEDIDTTPALMQSLLIQFFERAMSERSQLRLMTATRVDLFERVSSKQFSDNLFYRLNCIHLVVPPLRDRPEDIPILFRHYLSSPARGEAPRLSSAAWDRLVAYSWPGNLHELKAVADRLRTLPRLVEPGDLPVSAH